MVGNNTKANIMIRVVLDTQQLFEKLKGIPGAAEAAMRSAIRKGLSKTKTAMRRMLLEKYTVAPAYLRDAIGKPKFNALEGTITIRGMRIPLSKFTHKDVYPGGVEIQERRDSVITLTRAFAPGHPRRKGREWFFEREGEGAPRFPLRLVMGLSVPNMVHERKIEPALKEVMEAAATTELNRVMNGFLSGKLEMRGNRISAADDQE
jgi:hypothetical protein